MLLTTCLTLLVSTPAWAQPLSGTFTIGSGRDYTGFAAAAADLAGRGIDGPVVFEVLPGTYTEQLDLPAIAGTSAANTVTFRAQSGDAADVILQTSAAPLGSFVVRFDGAAFVTLEDLTLTSTASSLRAVIEIATGSSDVTVRRTVITGTSFDGIRAFGQGIHNLTLVGNTISTSTGIRLEGQFSANDLREPLIEGNVIAGTTTNEGIDLTRVDGAHVLRNRITARSQAVDLVACTGSTRTTLIANNIGTVEGVQTTALQLTNGTTGVDVVHNSFSTFGIRNLNSAALRVRSSVREIRLFNNSFTQFGQSVAVEVDDPVSITDSDFNNVYSDWVGVARWDGFHADLASLQAATGLDANSISVHPHYASDTDLHTASPYLDGRGTPRPDVTTDLDGDPRDAAAPDIGADEYAADPAATPLSGTVTVGGGGTYPTLSEAVADLALRGVDGPLAVELLAGIYTGAVVIPSIPGADATNRITIRSQARDTAAVRLTFESTTFGNTTLRFDSADFITLEHLTLENTSRTNAFVVDFIDQARGIIIQQCRLLNPQGSNVVHSNEQHPDELVIRDNDILSSIGSFGFFLEGLSFGPFIRTPVIEDNRIRSGSTGLFLQHVDGFHVLRNRIDSGIGLDLRVTTGSARRSRIANNFIHADGVGGRGIWVRQNTAALDVLNNSINTTDLNNTGNAAVEISASSNSDIRVLGNNLVNSGRGPAYLVEDPAAVSESDFNNIWAAGHEVARWDGGRAELPDLQAASGMDQNSISVFPNYVSTTDLHTASPYLAAAGTPLPEVTTDIDGDVRDPTAPAIGADEYTADPAATPLAGTFTIGDGGDYASFQTALDDLELRGVSAPVVFDVLDGIYTEQLVIHDIPGASAANPVTFRSQRGDSTAVTLTFGATDPAANYTVLFDSADFIRLEHLTLQGTGTSQNRILDFLGKAENVEIRRCRLANRGNPMIHSRDHVPDGLRIVENTFSSLERFGGDAIVITGFGFGPFVANIDIHGNRFMDPVLSDAVELTRVTGVHLTANQADIRGALVRMSDVRGSTRRSLIANNAVHATSNTTRVIDLTTGTRDVDVVYNSINATTGFLNALRINTTGTGLRVLNNILKTENGVPYRVDTPAAVDASDHNNLFSDNSSLAIWNGTHATLGALQAASGLDANSVSIDPPYVSATDLHLTSGVFDGLGTPIADVTTDLDGDPRDVFAPDIGADEINPITVLNPIADQTFPEDSGPVLVAADLNTVFDNPNAGATLTFTATSDTVAIQPRITGDSLFLDTDLHFFGSGTVEITTVNGLGQVGIDAFAVTVTPVNDAPTVARPLLDQAVAPNFGTLTFNLAGVFADVDGDALTFSAASDTLITVAVTDTTLTVGSRSGVVGLSTVVVTADDGVLSSADTFRVAIQVPGLFTLVPTDFPALSSSDAAWGDYDDDGDLDLVLMGFDDESTARVTRLYRNTGGAFERVSAALPGLNHGNAEWMDYDGDGDLDLLFSGGDDASAYRLRLYRNDGADTFTEIAVPSVGVAYGQVAWGDYDNDGDLDLAANGATVPVNTPASRIYRNAGGHFIELPIPLTDLQRSCMTWGDIDGDDDLDLLQIGFRPSTDDEDFANLAELYRNDDGVFVPLTTDLLGLTLDPACHFRDYDGDGDEDLLLSGSARTEADPFLPFAAIYRNDGPAGEEGWTFTDIEAGLQGGSEPTATWNDFDNDGDYDVLTTGLRTEGGQTTFFSTLYRNDDATFTPVDFDFPPLFRGDAAWGDADGDGDEDLLLTGRTTDFETMTAFYRNEAIFLNTPPEPPTNLTATADGTTLTFTWAAATDDETPSGRLTYNVRVGTSPGADDVFSGHAAPNGRRRVTGPGNAGTNRSLVLKHLTPGTTYFWSVQAIDTGGGASAFAPEATATPAFAPFTEEDPPVRPHNRGGAAWGDLDGDGLLDLAITGRINSPEAVTTMLRNDSGTLRPGADLVPLQAGDVAWGDYDLDGDLDLAVSGVDLDTTATRLAQTHLYRNDDGTLTRTADDLPGVAYRGRLAWVDVDNDGDLDLAVMGATQPINTPITRLFRNDLAADGTRRFVDLQADVDDVQVGGMGWADYDSDGDLDLLLNGFRAADTTTVTLLYRNDGGTFTREQTGLVGLSLADLAWGDYDADGDPDILMSGRTSFPDVTETSIIYRNDGPAEDGWTFTDIEADLAPLFNGAVAWADVDNDGDLDAFLTGSSADTGPLVRRAGLYRNDGGTFVAETFPFPGLSTSDLAWADADNDGDLDFLLAGFSDVGYAKTRFYRNHSPAPNAPPSPPTGLQAEAGTFRTTLQWAPGGDAETPTAGLTYNVRLGTRPGAGDVMAAQTNPDGSRQTAGPGNVHQNTRWAVSGLLPGTYYWSVQTVDAGFAASAFAREDSFQVSATRISRFRTNINKEILSRTTLTDSLVIRFGTVLGKRSRALRVGGISVRLDTVRHTNVDDLILTLVHDGVRDTLVFQPGVSGADFLGTAFADSATVSLAESTAPFTGTFRPYRPLSAFTGQDPDGAWVLEVFDQGTGNTGRLDAWALTLVLEDATATEAAAAPELPTAFALDQNYPNPFNPTTTIRYALPQRTRVTLDVFDVTGRRVARLVQEEQAPGIHTVTVDGSRWASGLYLYRLSTGSAIQTRKMLLVK